VLVTREADYAVRCVVEVARTGRTSAAQVARVQGISPTFLGKIVQSLAKAGILATRRGVGGGISLAKPAEEFTLLQVIEAVEGPLCINDCLQSPSQCGHVSSCPAYPYLWEAQARLRETLDVSFAELVGPDGVPAFAPAFVPALVRPEEIAPNGARDSERKRVRTADPAARGDA
jgi:Rrf2 family protein